MKKKVSIRIIIFLVIFLGIYSMPNLWETLSPPRIGGVEETWETSNRTFKLQIERRSEQNGGFVHGAYYVYKSAPENSDNWQTIFIQRHDDPNPISTNSARFIDPKTAYVFFGPKFAVTLDGGDRWTIWDAWEANKTADFKMQGLYPSISDVQIDSSGQGEMQLHRINSKAINRVLKTNDFGRNWKLE